MVNGETESEKGLQLMVKHGKFNRQQKGLCENLYHDGRRSAGESSPCLPELKHTFRNWVMNNVPDVELCVL